MYKGLFKLLEKHTASIVSVTTGPGGCCSDGVEEYVLVIQEILRKF